MTGHQCFVYVVTQYGHRCTECDQQHPADQVDRAILTHTGREHADDTT